MNRKRWTSAIALALFFLGGAMVVKAAVQGTDIDETVGDNSRNINRVGTVMDPSTTRNPLMLAGIPTHPVVRQEWDRVNTGVTSSIVVNSLNYGSDDGGTTDSTGLTSSTMDHARNILVWAELATDADATERATFTLTVAGTGYYASEVISETFQFNGVTSATDNWRQTGTKAFKTITAVTVTAGTYETGYGLTSVSLDMSVGSKLGLRYKMREDTVLAELWDTDGTGGCVRLPTSGTVVFGVANDAAFSASSADFRGTWTPPSYALPDGTNDYVLYYVTTDIDDLYYADK